MSLLVTALAFAGGLFMAWAIGATNAPAFGPVNAARAAPVYRSSLLVGVASFVGAVTQGEAVATTIGSDLIVGATILPIVSAIVLLTAATLIFISTIADIPMPSAFLLVGGTIGAGLAAGGAVDGPTATRILGVWLAIPVVGMAIGYATARLTRRLVDESDRDDRRIRALLVALGIYTAFTAGANQAGLPVGPLMNVTDLPLIALLVFAGAGMMVGAWTGSPRLIQAISQEYAAVGPRRAVGALVAASSIAQVATLMGVPISFGQTVIFSIVGSGLVAGSEGIGRRKMAVTVGAWTGALAVSTATAYGLTLIALGAAL